MRTVSQCSIVLASAFALLVAGCGGGGGGGGGTNGGGIVGTQSPGLTVSTTSLATSADAGTSTTPTANFNITVSNPPTAGVYIGGQFTQNGIASIDLQPTTQTDGTVVITFKDPSILGPGVYDDTVQVGICTDSTCNAVRSETQHSVAVKYTVTGTKPPPATVSASTNVVNVQAVLFDPTAPSAAVDLIIQGIQPSSVNTTTDYTTDGVAYAGTSLTGSGGFQVQIAFDAPGRLAPGTHDDTITISLCPANSCPVGLAGSPIIITTHYTVSSTVTGTNGYTIRVVTAPAYDIAWDDVSGNIYLSSPSSAPTHPNSVVALDPVSGALGLSGLAGTDPTFEAISGDGQFLYVGLQGSNTIQRLKLPSLAKDITLPMGSNPSGPLFAGEIEVLPGQPNTVAVARSATAGYSDGYDVTLFDDATPRANALHRTDVPMSSIQWGATSDTLYGVGFSTFSIGTLTTMGVDGTGVKLVASDNLSRVFNGRIHFDAGVLYTDIGLAIDAASRSELGAYLIAGGEGSFGALPDSNLNRIFFVMSGANGSFLRSYDLSTYTAIAELPLFGVGFPPNRPTRIVRWGADGLAIPTADGRVLLITGPFVKP